MFRGLFGSNSGNSPSPPKNQIEVVCPSCGAAQYEPRLVVSTFCKSCGVHLRLEKKKVIASAVSKAGGRPDVLVPTRQPVPMNPPNAPVSAPAATAPLVRPSTVPLIPLTPVAAAPLPGLPAFDPDISETGELGLGMMLQAASVPLAPAPRPVVSEVVHEPVQVVSESEAQPEVDSGTDGEHVTGHLAAETVARVASHVPIAIAELMQQSAQNTPTGTLQKMREQGAFRQQYFKEAECFDCSNKFKVGRSSRSANCPSCGAYISLEDVELNLPSSQAIKTRGDVMIRKRGHLTASHLYARDLRCFGLVEANIFCSGDATFKTTGTIIGEVKCKKFLVEKGSEITFMNPVHADDIEIHGVITGHVYSKGPVIIGNGGAVNGDVTARSVSIEPGGELNGSMNIVRTAK